MHKIRLFSLSVALAVLAPAAHAEPITPSRKLEAKQHYEAGSRKFDVAKYEEAAAEFEAAYEIIGDPVILYNIAQSYRLAQKHERALFFYKSYLRKVDSPQNKSEVESRIADLTKVLAEQKRATEAPPTGLSRPGETPQKPTRVATTEHPETTKPETTKPETTKPETTKPEETKPEETKPEENAGQVVTPPPPPPPVNRAPLYRIIGYSMAGLAVVGLALGATGAAMASSASSDVENAAKTHTPFDPSLENKGKNFDIIGIVGWTLAGVGAAGAGVFLYLGLKPQPRARAANTIVVPFASSQTAGVAVIGRF